MYGTVSSKLNISFYVSSLEPAGMKMTPFLLVAPAGTCLHQLQDDLMAIGQREVLEGAQIG